MKYFQLAETIYAFSSLKKNWDSYNADTISQVAIEAAIKLLDNLFTNDLSEVKVNVFPMRDGGIQFEFDGSTISAELEINPNGVKNFILFDDDGNMLENVKILN